MATVQCNYLYYEETFRKIKQVQVSWDLVTSTCHTKRPMHYDHL
jgi:hypothetical protein